MSYIYTKPIGEVFYFAGSTNPARSLLCDGSLISRTTYAALFASIGTVWGIGDNSTTFALPYLTGAALALPGQRTYNLVASYASGSTTITLSAAPQYTLGIGMLVTGTGIPANSYITAISSNTVFTINANTTAAGSSAAIVIKARNTNVLGSAGGTDTPLITTAVLPATGIGISTTTGSASVLEWLYPDTASTGRSYGGAAGSDGNSRQRGFTDPMGLGNPADVRQQTVYMNAYIFTGVENG